MVQNRHHCKYLYGSASSVKDISERRTGSGHSAIITVVCYLSFMNENNMKDNILDTQIDNDSDIDEVENKYLNQMIRNAESDFQADLMYQIQKSKVPSRKENVELVVRAQNGDNKAMEDLIIRNGKLVVKYVSRFYGLEYGVQDDLIQEGLLGLQRAAQTFDVKTGNSFSTYAMFWIRQKVVRYVQTNYEAVRAPVHIEDKLIKIRKLISNNALRNNNGLSIEEIAKELHMSKSSVALALQHDKAVLSLNEIMIQGESEDCDVTLMNVLQSETNIEDETLNAEANSIIMNALDKYLTPVEKEIILKRFGFMDGKNYSLAEIAKIRGVSRERIRQQQEKALSKLRIPFKNMHMSDFFDINPKAV